jgi:peptidoglycan/xylan/chitin deacetylase (PgdA/CDA1 family)
LQNNRKSILTFPDKVLSKIYLRTFKEKNSLIIPLFHLLFKNSEEKNKKAVDPTLGITVDCFRQIVKHFLDNSYKFVSPDDILKGLSEKEKYVMITFDDGYYNNIHALPILNEYHIPGVFFVTTDNVENNKCFWWDVIYRERIKMKQPIKKINHEIQQLKSKKHDDIEKYLIDLFGKTAFVPKGEVDRPFNPSELKEFSRNKYVFIGNHTKNHAILTNYSSKEIKHQLLESQKALQDLTGKTPNIIAYPNGNHSDKIINISNEVGLKLGLTVKPKKNYLPIDCNKKDCMKLNRFYISYGRNISEQCELFRSDFILHRRIYNLIKKPY